MDKFLLLFLVFVVFSSFVSAGLENGLNNAFYLEDLTDTNGGADLSLVNTPVFTSSGKIGGAYDFEDADLDGMSFTSNLNPTGPFTISLWVKPESISVSDLYVKTNVGMLWLYSDNRMYTFTCAGSSSGTRYGGNSFNTATKPSIGVWTHIVWSSPTRGGTQTIYKNNVSYTSSTSADGTCSGYVGRLGLETTNTNPYDGLIDEVYIWNRTLNASEISEIYALTRPLNIINNDFSFNDNYIPLDNNSFSQSFMNFSQDATIVNNTLNCSLIINSNITNSSNVYSSLTNESYYFNITFNESFSVPGEFNWSVSCFSDVTNETTNSSTRTFYLDNVFPAISTSFVNNSFYFVDNLSTQINFSDDFYLNSYNVSVDGVSVASNSSLTGLTAQLNLSTSIYNLSFGLHTLTIELADGHTANKIPDYSVSTGLFNDRMEYGWKDSKGRDRSVKIKNSDGSLFDTFTTEKQVDRYTWNFEPSLKKDTYFFDIEADDDIRIIEANETYLGSWITFGDKWMDFDLYGEDSVVKITRTGSNKVKVKISNIKNPAKQKYQSIGDLNIISVNYSFYKVNASLTYQTAVFEGAFTSLDLELETSDLLTFNNSASLVWNNVSRNVSRTNVSGDVVDYTSLFLVSGVNTSNVSWTWFFNVSGYEFNVSGMSEFIQMDITNCSAGDYIVLNYTIYDEETQDSSTNINATIRNYLTITTPDYTGSVFEFTILEPDDNLLICLPNNTLDVSSWILDARTKYSYEDHVEEFHYIDNFLLNNSVIPKTIKLFDLATDDSTSFVVTYQDENYIYVENVIIDLLRQYTSLNGEFFSVENGKTDVGGQTTLHFVTEDVIYKANVFQDGVLIYTSGEFQAICQASPCQINLRKQYDNSEGVSFLSNIYYDISSQYEFYNSKQIVFDFSTIDGTSTNVQMIVTKSTSQLNETICDSTKTLSSGSIVCIITPSFYNATFTARIYKDGDFLGWRTYTLEPNADDTFGRTGVFLAGIGYLILSFMAISSAIASIVLGVLGLMAMISMNLLIGGSFFGIGSTFIWLIIAGGIIIWKLTQRRVQ